MNQNFNNYKVFYEVARSKTITEASKKLFLSQPATSKAIQNLEQALGVTLFYRTLNGIILTRKGEELLYYVEQAFNNFRMAEKKMIEERTLERGFLYIGIPSNIASFYIVDDIIKFHQDYPNIVINIISRSTSEMLSMLDKNLIDIVIDLPSSKDNLENFDVKKLTDLSYCFVCSKDKFNFKANKSYSLKDLENVLVILPVFNSSHRERLNNILKANDVNLNNILSIETSEMIYSMVKNNLGVGYILYDMVKNDIEKGDLIKINLHEEMPLLPLNLIYREKNLTDTSIKFINDFLSIKK